MALHQFDLAPDAVRQRFAWARRQGQPRWLWPDISVDQWRLALNGIEQVLRSVLSGTPHPVSLDGDAATLGIAGYTSATGPLLGWWIEQGLIVTAPEVSDVLKLHLNHNRLRMKLLNQETAALARLLAGAGLEPIVIKGMHTAQVYFPEPGTRPAADIDLLISAEAEPSVAELLSSAGYEPGPRMRTLRNERNWKRPGVASLPVSLAFVHAHDPWAVDLQCGLDRGYAAGTPIVRLDEERSSSAIAPWPLMTGAKVLRQPLLLLHLAVHACCDLTSLSLLRLVELIFVIRRDTADGTLEWSELVAMAKRAGAFGLIYPAFKLCNDLAPDTVPKVVIADSRAHVPDSVRRVIDPLCPADAQRFIRWSLRERFMWTDSPTSLARQITVELLPISASIRDCAGMYAMMAWRLARGTVTR